MVVLARVRPFVAVVDDERLRDTCSHCFAHPTTLQYCPDCDAVAYCNVQCWQFDHRSHRGECDECTEAVLNEEISIQWQNFERFGQRRSRPYNVVGNQQQGGEDVQGTATICQYTYCSFVIEDNTIERRRLGVGVYLGLSVHEHSCDPDCFLTFDGSEALLRTVKSQQQEIAKSPRNTVSTDNIESFSLSAGPSPLGLLGTGEVY